MRRACGEALRFRSVCARTPSVTSTIRFRTGLRRIDGIILDPDSPSTNMVYFNLADTVRLSTEQISQQLRPHGILVAPEDSRRFRLVTHYWIDDEGVQRAIQAFGEVLSN